VNLDILVENRSDSANIRAAYGIGDSTKKSFSASMSVLSKLKSSSTTVNAYVVGAPQDVTLLHIDRLEDDIRALVATCNYGTADPITYKLADMNGRTIGVHSVTDEFTYEQCTPAASVFVLQSAKVNILTGDDNKETPSTFGVSLNKRLPNGNTVMLLYSPADNHRAEDAVN
jgi:hypothetical protein